MLTHRPAEERDIPFLAELNRQLIQDEGHRNRMDVSELEQRMRNWLRGEYRAVIFEQAGEIVAYALYRHYMDSTYLRQFFVGRPHRRRGVGRAAMAILLGEIWHPGARITLDVLAHNLAAQKFWRDVGFKDYALMMEQTTKS
jgi:ribosomal protein S18 acetylase RimI-like enzyme